MKKFFHRLSALTFSFVTLLGVVSFHPSAKAQTDNKELVAKGQYVFALAGGCACHTVPKGPLNAGGREFPIPTGAVYSTNITSDKETGLGGWTDQQILDALTKGLTRDGSRILPVMPYEKYSGMRAQREKNIAFEIMFCARSLRATVVKESPCSIRTSAGKAFSPGEE